MVTSAAASYQATTYSGGDARNLEHSNANKSFFYHGQWWAVLPDGPSWSIHGYSGAPSAPGTLGGWTEASSDLLSTGARADTAFDAPHGKLWVLNFGPSTVDPHLYRLGYASGRWLIEQNISLAASGLTDSSWSRNNEIALGLDQNGNPLMSAIGAVGLHVAYATHQTGLEDWSTWTDVMIDAGTTRGGGGSSGHSKADFVAYTDSNGINKIGLAYGADNPNGADSWKFASHSAVGGGGGYGGGWTLETIVSSNRVSVDNHISTVSDGSTVFVAMKDNNNTVWITKGASGHWDAPVQVTHGTAADGPSRPTLVLDDTNHELYIFYQDSTRNPHDIHYKQTSTSSLSFDPTTLGTRVLTDSHSTFTDPQLAAQHVGDATGAKFFVFAHGSGRQIWYHEMDLPHSTPPVGTGGGIVLGPDRSPAGGGGSTITGSVGNDKLSGGGGSDRLYGQAGNDWIVGGAGNDTLAGAAGNDTLSGGSGNDWLRGGLDDDKLYGDAGRDALYGSAGDDGLAGGTGRDRLYGEDGADWLFGGRGNDRLYGGLGNDHLYGGSGRDLLYGGIGQDTFVFSTRGASNVDRIGDFHVRDDAIWLDDAVFRALGRAGSAASPALLNANYFWKGEAAHDVDDHVIYNTTTGALSYDADGTGTEAAVKIAQLKANLKITAHDFFVV